MDWCQLVFYFAGIWFIFTILGIITVDIIKKSVETRKNHLLNKILEQSIRNDFNIKKDSIEREVVMQ